MLVRSYYLSSLDYVGSGPYGSVSTMSGSNQKISAGLNGPGSPAAQLIRSFSTASMAFPAGSVGASGGAFGGISLTGVKRGSLHQEFNNGTVVRKSKRTDVNTLHLVKEKPKKKPKGKGKGRKRSYIDFAHVRHKKRRKKHNMTTKRYSSSDSNGITAVGGRGLDSLKNKTTCELHLL